MEVRDLPRGQENKAKLRLRGKTLSVCLALNPDEFTGTKYRVESLAQVKAYKHTPCAYRVKTDRRFVMPRS